MVEVIGALFMGVCSLVLLGLSGFIGIYLYWAWRHR